MKNQSATPREQNTSGFPDRDRDPLTRLECHYFYSADLMLRNYRKLKHDRARYKSIRKLRDIDIDSAIYLKSWLAYLCVVFEAIQEKESWKELNGCLIKSKSYLLDITDKQFIRDEISAQYEKLTMLLIEIRLEISVHYQSLKHFRNRAFHYANNPEKLLQFSQTDPTRLVWAEALHSQTANFFSEYRIARAVYSLVVFSKNELLA